MSTIHPSAIVDASAQLGDDIEIGPYCIIGAHVKLGDRVRLQSHVVIEGVTEVGEDCQIYPFAHLGGPPQHAGHKGEATRLWVGARNVIREHVTMHCGTAMGHSVTTVGSDGFFMVGVHIGHDCVVGDKVVMANNATLGGHVAVADHVIMGGCRRCIRTLVSAGMRSWEGWRA